MSAATPEALAALVMRPGRRRMLDLLIAAGAEGVTAEALCLAYYGDTPIPAAGSASAACQRQRLRSQITPLGYGIERVGHAHARGQFFLVEPKAEREIAEVAVEARREPPHRALNIVATPGFRGVSVARLAFLDGAGRAAG